LNEDGDDGLESDASLKDIHDDRDITDIESDTGSDEDERENEDVDGKRVILLQKQTGMKMGALLIRMGT
jgi:hypothetical protein